MIADTTGGCEPLYNVACLKNVSQDVQGDDILVEFDSYFLRVLEANDIDVESVKTEAREAMMVNEFDSIGSLSDVPDSLGELFVTAGELTGIEHGSVQCALQKGVDSSISKTLNFPNDATVDEMDEAFRHVYDNGGKAIASYRDGSRTKQVLTTRADNDGSEQDDSTAAESDESASEEIDDESLATTDESDETPVLGESEDERRVVVPRERPHELIGATYRIATGYGKVYITVNGDNSGHPFELFANIGSSGGFTNSMTEALAKQVSLSLRSGVDPNEVVEMIQGDSKPTGRVG